MTRLLLRLSQWCRRRRWSRGRRFYGEDSIYVRTYGLSTDRSESRGKPPAETSVLSVILPRAILRTSTGSVWREGVQSIMELKTQLPPLSAGDLVGSAGLPSRACQI